MTTWGLCDGCGEKDYNETHETILEQTPAGLIGATRFLCRPCVREYRAARRFNYINAILAERAEYEPGSMGRNDDKRLVGFASAFGRNAWVAGRLFCAAGADRLR